MRRFGILGAMVLTIALVVVATGAGAQARFSPRQLEKEVIGGSLWNHRSHVLVSITGHHRYKVKVRGRKLTVSVARVSAQHCKFGKHPRCWGPIRHATLKHRVPLGRTASSTSRFRGAARGIHMPDSCYFVGLPALAAHCINPYNWTRKSDNPVAVKIHDWYTKPCVEGEVDGVLQALGINAGARVMLAAGGAELGATASGALYSVITKVPQVFGAIVIGNCLHSVAAHGAGLQDRS